MKRLRIALCFILAAFAAGSFAQVSLGWSSEYTYNSYGMSAQGAHLINTGEFYTVGTELTPPFFNALVVKYDINGLIEWYSDFQLLDQHVSCNGSCTDAAGNLYVVGQVPGTSNGMDAVVFKFSPDGTMLWGALFDGPGHYNDVFNNVTVDDQGSVYVVGQTYTNSTTFNDFLVAKYNASGQFQWSAIRDDDMIQNDDFGVDIRVDAGHNVYMGGSAVGVYAELMKFNSSGVYQWSATSNKAKTTAYSGIELGPNNTVYFVSTGNYVDGNVKVLRFTSAGSQVFASYFQVANVDADYAKGTSVDASGQLVFGIRGLQARFVKLNASGGVIWDYTNAGMNNIGGLCTQGTNTFLTGETRYQSGKYASEVDKLDPSGSALWSRSFPILPGSDYSPISVSNVSGLVANFAYNTSGNEVTAMYFENPVANNDQYKCNAGSTLTVPLAAGLLANDSLALGAHAVLVASPSHGTLTLANDGSFGYVPNAGFVGADTFTYRDAHGLSSSNTATVTISVQPPLTKLTMSPAELMGGDQSTGTVTLGAAAPIGGVVVNLSASSGVIQVPASVTVPSGQASVTFTANTSAVGAIYVRYVTAECNGITKTASLTLDKTVSLSSLTVSPNVIAGGQNTTGTVTLSSAAPVGGSVVTLSDNTSVLGTPASVTVAAGAVSANFTITSLAVSSTVTRTVSAAYRGVTKNANVTLEPYYALTSLTLNPTTVKGGQSSVGTVTLTGPAPIGGEVVTLKSGSSVIHVPASVTVLAGQMSATFTATTSQVAATVTRQISATYGTVTKVANLTITP